MDMPRDSAAIYDYLSAEVPSELEHLYNDCYENLGWQPIEPGSIYTGNAETNNQAAKLAFRRDRNIPNRIELGAMQKKCESQLKTINSLIHQGEILALILSLSFGVVGGGLVTGAVFAFISTKIVLGVLLAVLGAVTCGVAYPLNQRIRRTAARHTTSALEIAKDDLFKLFQESYNLWHENI
jgi:hypothetical protein